MWNRVLECWHSQRLSDLQGVQTCKKEDLTLLGSPVQKDKSVEKAFDSKIIELKDGHRMVVAITYTWRTLPLRNALAIQILNTSCEQLRAVAILDCPYSTIDWDRDSRRSLKLVCPTINGYNPLIRFTMADWRWEALAYWHLLPIWIQLQSRFPLQNAILFMFNSFRSGRR